MARPAVHAQALGVHVGDAQVAVEEGEGLAHVVEDIVGPVPLGPEGILEIPLTPLGFHPARLVGEDEEADRRPLRIENAGVGECPPRVRLAAVGGKLPGQVVEASGAAGEGILDDGPRLFPGVGPNLVEPLAHGPGQAWPEQGKYVSLKKKLRSGPQATIMLSGEFRTRLRAVLNSAGHVSGGPRG